jgi:hypothetical protein
MGPVPVVAGVTGNAVRSSHVGPGFVSLHKEMRTHETGLQIRECPVADLVTTGIVDTYKIIGASAVGYDDVGFGVDAVIGMRFSPHVAELVVINSFRDSKGWS